MPRRARDGGDVSRGAGIRVADRQGARARTPARGAERRVLAVHAGRAGEDVAGALAGGGCDDDGGGSCVLVRGGGGVGGGCGPGRG